jgi:hypothetical protein
MPKLGGDGCCIAFFTAAARYFAQDPGLGLYFAQDPGLIKGDQSTLLSRILSCWAAWPSGTRCMAAACDASMPAAACYTVRY